MDSLLTDKIKFLHGLLKLCANPARAANNNLVVTLPTANVSFAKGKLDHWKIPYENIIDGELLINLSSIHAETFVFFQEINFRQNIEIALDATTNITKNIALIDYKNSFLIYDIKSNKTCLNSEITEADFLIDNALCYYKILRILKSKEFADYVNTKDKEIILYSGTKGIMRIEIPDYMPNFDSCKSTRHDCDTLVSKIGSSDFKMYFKNQLFDFRNSDTVTDLKRIILSLQNLTRQADNNLQLYLKNFSFEKLKDDLQKEKEKYFGSLRDILGKNLSQIVAIPVSFAASVFATYRVNDIFILVIILAAFVLYSIFTYYLQSLYLADVIEIEGTFERDFTTIVEKSGLPVKDIYAEKIKIERRIANIKTVVLRFRYLVAGLTAIFIIFICYQVYKMV
ncbi:MAG: hypothetical protein ABI416_10310 [Ginsengibacter sp.]